MRYPCEKVTPFNVGVTQLNVLNTVTKRNILFGMRRNIFDGSVYAKSKYFLKQNYESDDNKYSRKLVSLELIDILSNAIAIFQ